MFVALLVYVLCFMFYVSYFMLCVCVCVCARARTQEAIDMATLKALLVRSLDWILGGVSEREDSGLRGQGSGAFYAYKRIMVVLAQHLFFCLHCKHLL